MRARRLYSDWQVGADRRRTKGAGSKRRAQGCSVAGSLAARERRAFILFDLSSWCRPNDQPPATPPVTPNKSHPFGLVARSRSRRTPWRMKQPLRVAWASRSSRLFVEGSSHSVSKTASLAVITILRPRQVNAQRAGDERALRRRDAQAHESAGLYRLRPDAWMPARRARAMAREDAPRSAMRRGKRAEPTRRARAPSRGTRGPGRWSRSTSGRIRVFWTQVSTVAEARTRSEARRHPRHQDRHRGGRGSGGIVESASAIRRALRPRRRALADVRDRVDAFSDDSEPRSGGAVAVMYPFVSATRRSTARAH